MQAEPNGTELRTTNSKGLRTSVRLYLYNPTRIHTYEKRRADAKLLMWLSTVCFVIDLLALCCLQKVGHRSSSGWNLINIKTSNYFKCLSYLPD